LNEAIKSHEDLILTLKALHSSLLHQLKGQPDSTTNIFKAQPMASDPGWNLT